MTVVGGAVLAILWATAAYRTVIAARRPARYRTTAATSLVLLACAVTFHVTRTQFNEMVGAPNAAALGVRLCLAASATTAHLYLLDVRERSTACQRRLLLGFGLFIATVSTLGWILAPIHDQELLSLADAPRTIATLAFVLPIYAQMSWFLIALGRYAFTVRAELKPADPPAAIAVTLIGAGAWIGLSVMFIFAIRVLLPRTHAISEPLGQVGSLTMPTSLVLVSAGFLMLPVASKLEHRRHATVQAQALGPLWAALLRRHPQVHLPLTSLTNPGPRFISQRRLIEISDALEEVLVDDPRDIDELAQAIVNPPTNTARTQAKEALIRIDPTPWPQPILGLSRAVARQTGTDEEDLRRLQQARPSSAARGIAAALTPANLVLALLAYASLRHAGAQSGLFWFALTAVFVVLVPYLILGWALRTGRVDDRQVVRRSQRPALLAAAATSVALAVALLVVLDAPAPLTALVVAMLAGLMVMATISLALKASMHLAVAAGAATILAVDGATPLAGLAFLTLPVLGWARWREGRHSVVQLAAGAALGSLVAGLLYSALR